MYKRVMNKSGVSAVVATVLIIMITIAAVGIVWAVIIPMIRDNLGSSVACNDVDVTIGTSQGYTCYDSAQKLLSVQVVKGANDINVTGLKFSVSYSGNSVFYNEKFNFEKSSSRVSYVNVADLAGVDEIGLVTVLSNGKKEMECSKIVLKTIPSCSLGSVTAINDPYYPLFFNYLDNNNSLYVSGKGLFNVTIENTNGTVMLEINGTNITASSSGSNVYKAEYTFASGGTYSYRWHSWGNGTANNYKISEIKSYYLEPAFNGGDGSSSNPYQIASWRQLNNMRNNLNANYILMNNLGPNDAGYSSIASATANSNAGWLPIDLPEQYIGNNFGFDGNGKTISNLVINKSVSGVGFFGSVYAATLNISNLNLNNVSVIGPSSTGSLIGYAPGNENSYFRFYNITNCNVSGSVVSTASSAGGLVGQGYSLIVVSSSFIGNVTGRSGVGGLVGMGGYLSKGSANISSSFFIGNVTGSSLGIGVGGLVGRHDGIINNSYSMGNVKGNNSVGGLIGFGLIGIDFISSSFNSYATGNVSGTSYVGGLIGKPSSGIVNVSNSYATGNVSGTSYVGGLIGNSSTNVIISNSYWFNRSQGLNCYSGGNTGCIANNTESYFKNSGNSPMNSWDFTNVWKANSGSYPTLKWQNL